MVRGNGTRHIFPCSAAHQRAPATTLPNLKTACAFVIVLPILLGATVPFPVEAQMASAGAEAKIADARQHVKLSQFTQAEQELRTVLALQPDATEAHYLLGYTLFREQRASDSLAEYAAGARLGAPTAEELTVIASDYILLKDLSDAVKWLVYATVHEPSNAEVWYLLGRTQYTQDHVSDAAHSFSQCLELRPRDARAEYNLGLAYEKLHQPETAIAAYHTAIGWQSSEKHPDPQPYLNLGTLLFRQGKAAEALDPLRQAVTFSPGNAFANQQLGLAFEALGRYDEAIVALKRAAALAPKAEQPHFFLGRIYHHLGRNADAAAEYAIVSRLLGTHSDTETPNVDH